MATEKPKGKNKLYERITQPRFLTALVALILLVIIGINLATTLYGRLTETPDCDTRAGYQLVFASNSNIYLTDESTGQPHDIAEFPFPSTSLTWSPDSQWIAFTEIDGPDTHIRVISINSELTESITFPRDDDRRIYWQWLPDSQTMIVIAPVDEGWQLVRWQVGNDEATPLVTHEINSSPEWELSPDGTQIAAIVNRNNRDDMLLIDTATGDTRTVLEDVLDSASVEWSHDGQDVLLTNGDLYRITAADGTVTRLTSVVRAGDAHWSPDNSRIAYTHQGGLYVIPSDGGDTQQLVESMVQFDFDWSPDGEWLLFNLSDEDQTQYTVIDVGVVNVDGSGFANLSGTDSFTLPLDWSADSQYILYQDQDDATGDRSIYITTLAADETIQVSQDSPLGAVWSPDGRYVAVEIDNRLHLVEAATGERCIVHRDGSAYPYIWRRIPIE